LDKAYWESVADRFDDEVLKILDRDRTGILLQTIIHLGAPSKTVADFGCGNGSLLPALSQSFKHVVAFDHSAALLADAKSRNKPSNNIDYCQADLSQSYSVDRKVDVCFCVNVLLHPDTDLRASILENAIASLKRRGTFVLVVPAFESLLHTYHTIVETNVVNGVDRSEATAEVQAVYAEEVISSIEGIVSLGSEPTKMHTQEEARSILLDQDLTRIESHRVEYDWAEMIDDAPEGLGEPYPWDWLLTARKP
jgi:SAM-dependent methyltransferase